MAGGSACKLSQRFAAKRPDLSDEPRNPSPEAWRRMVREKSTTPVSYMERHANQVKTPSHAPIFLPAWVVGNFDPKELAIIIALQGYGASSQPIEISTDDLARATCMPKGALPVLLKKLEREGLIERSKTYEEITGRPLYDYQLKIWEFEHGDCD